jgi:dihydroorotate dehydrogenase (NAD+) catalytic subunit
MRPSLSIDIAGMRLRNPTILASGVLGLSGVMMRRVAESGAGAIVTKSIGLKPRKGYPNPTFVRVVSGYVNAMGLPNPGIKEFLKELLIASEGGVPIIVSVFGSSIDEMVSVIERVERVADALELNLSCPHVQKTGLEMGSDPELVTDVVSQARLATRKPMFVKLSPLVSDIAGLARACEKAGADGITAVNTAKAMVIDVEAKMPVLSNKVGGLSGPALKPIALRCVYEVYEAVKIPVIGCGGVTTWRDAVEFLMAGARGVQIGTGIVYKGLKIFKEVIEGIQSYMIKNKVEDVEELVGIAHYR